MHACARAGIQRWPDPDIQPNRTLEMPSVVERQEMYVRAQKLSSSCDAVLAEQYTQPFHSWNIEQHYSRHPELAGLRNTQHLSGSAMHQLT
jgi:hypothetical protein